MSYDGAESLYNSLVDEFNKYAKEENLNVELKLLLYTSKNASLVVNDYGTTLEYLLSKKSNKYDIIFYDVMYSHRYSPYLLDLGIRLPSKHISLYSSGIASQTCKYNDKWIGLVCNLHRTYKLNIYI